MHCDIFFYLNQLCHHIFIDVKTSGSIDDNDVKIVLRGMFHRRFCNVYRAVLIAHGKYFHALLLSVDLQLFDRCRPVDITCHEKYLPAFLLELSGKLCCCGRLTCSLKTGHHDDGDCLAGLQCDLGCLRAHQPDHLFVYNLDDHLSRIQSVHHVLSDRALLHIFDKLLDYLEIDIGL